jgi:hypothetical protein
MQTSSSVANNLIGVNSTGGTLYFGTTKGTTNQWYVREFQTANIHTFDGTPGSADDLSLDTSPTTYQVSLLLDVVNKTFSLVVDNLGDPGGPQTVASNVAFVGTFANPSTWNGLVLRSRGTDDTFNISYTIAAVPAPAALPAGAMLMGLIAFGHRRQR